MELSQAAREGNVIQLRSMWANGLDVDSKDSDKRTALHWAAAAGHSDAVEFLLSVPGVKVNTQDDGGWTPLMSAASAGHVEVTSLLLGKGADANLENDNGQIPLHYHRGRLEMAELLVDYTVNINKEDHSECTPLMRAIGGKPCRDVLMLLLDRGASLETRDHEGNTPLHVAVLEGHEDIVMLLLEAGASVTVRNKRNESVLDMCRKNTGLLARIQAYLNVTQQV